MNGWFLWFSCRDPYTVRPMDASWIVFYHFPEKKNSPGGSFACEPFGPCPWKDSSGWRHWPWVKPIVDFFWSRWISPNDFGCKLWCFKLVRWDCWNFIVDSLWSVSGTFVIVKVVSLPWSHVCVYIDAIIHMFCHFSEIMLDANWFLKCIYFMPMPIHRSCYTPYFHPLTSGVFKRQIQRPWSTAKKRRWTFSKRRCDKNRPRNKADVEVWKRPQLLLGWTPGGKWMDQWFINGWNFTYL